MPSKILKKKNPIQKRTTPFDKMPSLSQEITIVLTAVLLPCFAMLWHSNNIWDIFPKGLLIGIGHYVGIAAHINEISTQNPWNLVICKLHCKMAFILSKKEKKKGTRSEC